MNLSFRLLTMFSIGLLIVPISALRIVRGAEVPSLDEIFEMEKQIIESRRAITSGRVAVREVVPVCDSAPKMVNTSKKYVIYFEDDKIRSDQKFSIGGKRYLQQQVFTKDSQILALSHSPTVQLFGPETRAESSNEVPDPRRLGVICWGFDSISNMEYEQIFLNPKRDQFKVEAGTDEGEPVWKVSFRPTWGKKERRIEYWLSKNQGGLPVYIGVRLSDGHLVQSLRTKLRKHGADGVWFPSQVVFRKIREGKVTVEEVVTVEDATFGQDIPDETFTLAGLGLPKGRTVEREEDVLVWDGNRLVTQDVWAERSKTKREK